MYGQLPSYVKANATTYDLMVMETVLSWEKKTYDQANGVKEAPKLSQEQMRKMMARAKQGN